MQWYYYTSPIPAATDTVMFANNSGIYSLLVVNGMVVQQALQMFW